MRILLIGLLPLTLAACSDTNPQVSFFRSFGESLEFESTSISTSNLHAVVLKARCTPLSGQIELSLDSGNTWIGAQTYDSASSSTCSNGSFTVTLSKTKSPWNNITFSPGQKLNVKFRTQPKTGHYFYQDVQISYTPSVKQRQEVLVGSATQSGGGFIVKTRLRAHAQNMAVGGNFVVHGRIVE